ncbi:MAG: DUF2207 domain-containing protein [Leptospira sp.]|nr:DUF2207 domain-containing protein [Leptospira sp.]
MKSFFSIYIFPAIGLLFFAHYNTLFAQGEIKTLSWDYVHVEAVIKNNGRMEVRETLGIRFTGDWNGSYRYFDTGWGEGIRLLSVERQDLAGNWYDLKQGSIDDLDEYIFDKATGMVKWRSRNFDDPPFQNDLIVYRITVEYQGLFSRGISKEYNLNHDFSFSDREGQIGEMSVTISWEDQWEERTGNPSPQLYEATRSLQPGEGLVIKVPLKFIGDNSQFSNSPWLILFGRIGIWVLLLGILGLVQYLLYLLARKKGVFVEPEKIQDYKRCDELLGDWKPEEIAILAETDVVSTWITRLVASGDLRTGKDESGNFFLEKLSSDIAFSEEDKKIIPKIFVNGRNKVTASDIKEYYKTKKESFNLSSEVQKNYKERLKDRGLLKHSTGLWRVIEFVSSKVLEKPGFLFLGFIVFAIVYMFFGEPVLNKYGVTTERFLPSLFLTVFFTIVAIAITDDHYGLEDLKHHRKKYVFDKFIFSLIPSTVFLFFYIWQIPMEIEMLFVVFGFAFLLSLQHLIRYSPITFLLQIQTGLGILAVQKFLEDKLLDEDECDIPVGYCSFIPALDLTESVEYRIDDMKKTDCLHLIPENIERLSNVQNWDRSRIHSSSYRLSSTNFTAAGIAATTGLIGAGGAFGGAGASSAWSNVSNFASSSNYVVPSSSSGGGGGSSGGGGGGGW